MSTLVKIGEKRVREFNNKFELTEIEMALLIKLNYRYHTKMSMEELLG